MDADYAVALLDLAATLLASGVVLTVMALVLWGRRAS
jgi:hypothetical protein